MKEWEVIVVGGGPAGSTAARFLAEEGCPVVLVDKATFPREKCCAGLLCREVFQTFGELAPLKDEAVEVPFHKFDFHDNSFSRCASYGDGEEILGYLVLRKKFDALLLSLARKAGAEVLEGKEVVGVEQDFDGVAVHLEGAESLEGKYLIGADGINSVVARDTGLDQKKKEHQPAICISIDIPWGEDRMNGFFGEKRTIHVIPAYSFIPGYAWLFPKKEHICLGLGGALAQTKSLNQRFVSLVKDLKSENLIPAGMEMERPQTALNPVGDFHYISRVCNPRVVLVGDAGGFVTETSGEGISPGMRSGQVAAWVVLEARKQGRGLEAFQERAAKELGKRVKGIKGSLSLPLLVDLIFKEESFAHKMARAYLFGEPVGL